MANLYELTQEQIRLYDRLSSEDAINKETGEVDESLAEALQLNQEELENKIIGTVLVYKQLDADAVMIKNEIEALQERYARINNNAKYVKERLENSLLDLGMMKFDNPKFSISFRKTTKVEITDESLIPAEFMKTKTTVEPSKKDIADAIKKGQEVAGCYLEENHKIQIK